METIPVPAYLTEQQATLVRQTLPDELAALDEDNLLDLHGRVRRARTKYVKLYRRQGASLVADKGGRGAARPANRTAAAKAEVFELALARVSAQIDVVARAAAEQLRDERLAAARPPAYPSPDGVASPASPTGRSPARTTKTTGGLKRDASSRAEGARRQARRTASADRLSEE